MNVNMLTLGQGGYPEELEVIPSPPETIYWAGQEPGAWLTRPKIAIVGSRKISGYGRVVTARLSEAMARAGVVIISGLAYGVDITAHRSALEAGGITVAVLPAGINNIYPAAHSSLAHKITENGSLISEYPPDEPIAFKSNFIARNRIISGLADALLITEAAVNSGSLHTARFALEQGKTVMAVPGDITRSGSEGCNNLIKSGATPVTDVKDILFAMQLKETGYSAAPIFRGAPHEETIYRLIKDGLGAQEDLALAANIDAAALSGALTMLEISGYIRAAGNGRWIAN